MSDAFDVVFSLFNEADFGRPGNYFERQIGRWIKQYRGAETDPIPAMEALIERLKNDNPFD